MIAKCHTIENTASCLNYCDKSKSDQLYTSGVYGSASQIAEQMEMIQDQNSRAERKGLHAILSFSQMDEKKLTNEIKTNLIQEYLKKHGLEKNQAVAYEHKDTEYLHIHIVVNRISENRLCVANSHERRKNTSFIREMELEYGLQNKTGENKQKECFKSSIDKALRKSSTFKEFRSELRKDNIMILKGRGITFVDRENGVRFKGSSLGREYSLSNIEKRLEVENKEVEQNIVNVVVQDDIEQEIKGERESSDPGTVRAPRFDNDKEDVFEKKKKRNRPRF